MLFCFGHNFKTSNCHICIILSQSYDPSCHEKTSFMLCANNKDEGEPADSRSLISVFFVHCLDSKIPLFAVPKFQDPS